MKTRNTNKSYLWMKKYMKTHKTSVFENVSLGSRTNQSFVSIPFNRLIEQIKDKAKKYEGLKVRIVEESYTSKTDHLSLEEMIHQDSSKGKRVERGLFQSSVGKSVNADVNGVLNIMRKVVGDSEIVSRITNSGQLFRPLKFNFSLFVKEY